MVSDDDHPGVAMVPAKVAPGLLERILRRGPDEKTFEPGWLAVTNEDWQGDWLRYRFEQVHEWKWFSRDSYLTEYQGPHGPVDIEYDADRCRTVVGGASVPSASIEWGPKQSWSDKRGKGRYLFPMVRPWTTDGAIGGSPFEVSQAKHDGNAEQRSLQIASAIGTWTMRPSHSGSLWRGSGEQVTSSWRVFQRTITPRVEPTEVALVCLLTASRLIFLVRKTHLL